MDSHCLKISKISRERGMLKRTIWVYGGLSQWINLFKGSWISRVDARRRLREPPSNTKTSSLSFSNVARFVEWFIVFLPRAPVHPLNIVLLNSKLYVEFDSTVTQPALSPSFTKYTQNSRNFFGISPFAKGKGQRLYTNLHRVIETTQTLYP